MEQCSKAKWGVFWEGGRLYDEMLTGITEALLSKKLPASWNLNKLSRIADEDVGREHCRTFFSQSLKPTRNPAHKWIHGLEISVPAEHWRWVAAKQRESFWRRKGISVTQVQGRSHGFQLWICTLENSRENGSSRVRGRTGWCRRIVQEGSMVSQEKISEDVPGDERAEPRLEGEKEIGKC